MKPGTETEWTRKGSRSRQTFGFVEDRAGSSLLVQDSDSLRTGGSAALEQSAATGL